MTTTRLRLVPPADRGGAAFPPPLASRRALVCAGGGIMGAIYEMGVLAALEERLEGASINEFDFFVGVSAGSYVGTLLANGISPTVLYRSVTRSAGSRSDLDDMQLFRLNLTEILVRLARAPLTVAEAARDYVKNGRETTLTDLVASLAALLPSGFFTLEGLEEWLEVWLAQPGRTNDFPS